jgi:hypothetical protein
VLLLNEFLFSISLQHLQNCLWHGSDLGWFSATSSWSPLWLILLPPVYFALISALAKVRPRLNTICGVEFANIFLNF